MILQFDMWLRFYVDADCHFSLTAMEFFEDYNHAIDPYQLKNSDGRFHYYSKIYMDYLERVDKCQGLMSSLIRGEVDPKLMKLLLTKIPSERHLFAVAFAYWWNMTDTQTGIITSNALKTDWRTVWDGLNFFLCNPEAQELPPEEELHSSYYHGEYLRLMDNASNDREWVFIEHPEDILL